MYTTEASPCWKIATFCDSHHVNHIDLLVKKIRKIRINLRHTAKLAQRILRLRYCFGRLCNSESCCWQKITAPVAPPCSANPRSTNQPTTNLSFRCDPATCYVRGKAVVVGAPRTSTWLLPWHVEWTVGGGGCITRELTLNRRMNSFEKLPAFLTKSRKVVARVANEPTAHQRSLACEVARASTHGCASNTINGWVGKFARCLSTPVSTDIQVSLFRIKWATQPSATNNPLMDRRWHPTTSGC